MELKQLKNNKYPDNAIVVDWKTSPYNVMAEANTELNKIGLKIVEYNTGNDNFCFVITKIEPKEIKELKTVMFYDLEALKDNFITGDKKDFNYHFNLLKGNLKDLLKQYG